MGAPLQSPEDWTVGLIVWIILGLVVGFAGSRLFDRRGRGPSVYIVCGLMGALAGGFSGFFPAYGPGIRQDVASSMFSSVLGSVIVLLIYQAVTRGRVPSSGRAYAPNLAAADSGGLLDSLALMRTSTAAKAPEFETKGQASPSTSARIFITYRRQDDAAQAGRIYDRLAGEFGRDHIFMDVDAIQLGDDFVTVINEEVAKCDVLIALIGHNWLDASDEAGHRLLDDPDDFVRLEISAALQRQIPIIPILAGTKMPKADQLPPDLRGLARRQGLEVRHTSFQADMDRLVRELRRRSGSRA